MANCAKKDSGMERKDWFQFLHGQYTAVMLLPFPKISLAPNCPRPQTDISVGSGGLLMESCAKNPKTRDESLLPRFLQKSCT